MISCLFWRCSNHTLTLYTALGGKNAVYTPRSKGSAEFIFPYKWRPVVLTFFQLRLDLFIFTHLQEMGIIQSIILGPGKQFVLLNHGQRQISHSLHMLPQKICLIVVPLEAKGFTETQRSKFCFLNLFQKAWETLLNSPDKYLEAGTPSLSLFPAGISTYSWWAEGFNEIFSSSLLLYSIELAADLWGYLKAWHWKRKMLMGEKRGAMKLPAHAFWSD